MAIENIVLHGDSWLGLSEPYISIMGLPYGIATDSDLIAGNRSTLDWLWTGKDQIRQKANSLDPEKTVVFLSLGGVEAADINNVWTPTEIASFIIQIHYEWRAFPIWHFGYEVWPTPQQNTGFNKFYDAIYECQRSTKFNWVDMRYVLQPPVYTPDQIHLTSQGYMDRTNYIRLFWLRKILGLF